MRALSFILGAAAAFLLLAGEGRAHRVNVFAFVDGDAVRVECGFSRSSRVRNGKLIFVDAATGETVAEGTTDKEGVFRFRPPDAFLATGHGLTVRLLAGEGHAAEWDIPPEELRALARSGADEVNETAPPAPSAVDGARLEAMIGRVLDEKLAPVKHTLARLEGEAAGPGLRDIVGGIGWILGLLGLAACLKYGKRPQ